MIKQTCTRRIQFSAGHRVYGHEGHCANLHGHNYVVFVEAEADRLDSLGRIIDFSVIKERVGGWIDRHWDHGFLYWKEDRECATLFGSDERFITQKHWMCPFNPTAEEMAKYLLFDLGPQLMANTDVRISRIILWETENCFATASL